MTMEKLEVEVDFDGVKMTLKEGIGKIPGEDGWEKSRSREGFEKSAVELLDHGFKPDAALWFLHELYWSVAGCYGD